MTSSLTEGSPPAGEQTISSHESLAETAETEILTLLPSHPPAAAPSNPQLVDNCVGHLTSITAALSQERSSTSCSRGTQSTPSSALLDVDTSIAARGSGGGGGGGVIPEAAGNLVTKSPKARHQPQSQDLLSKCLAIQVRKTGPLSDDEQWIESLRQRDSKGTRSTRGSASASASASASSSASSSSWSRNGGRGWTSAVVGQPSAQDTTAQAQAREDDRDDEDDVEWWMYQNGFLVYQNFVGANIGCWWNRALQIALHGATFAGWAAPGILLLSGSPRLLEPFRTAWTRRVLRPPLGYQIVAMGDVEECCIRGVPQGQFTPLPDAVCWVIHDLIHSTNKRRGSAGPGSHHPMTATLDRILASLGDYFPETVRPPRDLIYVTLGKLIQERKVYRTRNGGYAIVYPGNSIGISRPFVRGERPLLFSSEEALDLMHSSANAGRRGCLKTVSSRADRLEDFTCQVSLADIMKGELEGDIICRTRSSKMSSVDGLNTLSLSLSENTKMARLQRHFSLRLHAAAATTLRRARRGGSLRSSSVKNNKCPRARTSRDSKEGRVGDDGDGSHDSDLSYLKMDISLESPRKPSLLERIFNPHPRPPVIEFAAQFPPPEWDDPRLRILHSVATQTAHTHSAKESPQIALREPPRPCKWSTPTRASQRTWRDNPDRFARSQSLPSRVPPSAAANLLSLGTPASASTCTSARQPQRQDEPHNWLRVDVPPRPKMHLPLDRTVSDPKSPAADHRPTSRQQHPLPPLPPPFDQTPSAAPIATPTPWECRPWCVGSESTSTSTARQAFSGRCPVPGSGSGSRSGVRGRSSLRTPGQAHLHHCPPTHRHHNQQQQQQLRPSVAHRASFCSRSSVPSSWGQNTFSASRRIPSASRSTSSPATAKFGRRNGLASHTKSLRCPGLLRSVQSAATRLENEADSDRDGDGDGDGNNMYGKPQEPVVRVVKIERTEETITTNTASASSSSSSSSASTVDDEHQHVQHHPPSSTSKNLRRAHFPTQTTIQENIPLDGSSHRRYKKVTIEKFEETTITEESVSPPIPSYVPTASTLVTTTTTTTSSSTVAEADADTETNKAEKAAEALAPRDPSPAAAEPRQRTAGAGSPRDDLPYSNSLWIAAPTPTRTGGSKPVAAGLELPMLPTGTCFNRIPASLRPQTAQPQAESNVARTSSSSSSSPVEIQDAAAAAVATDLVRALAAASQPSCPAPSGSASASPMVSLKAATDSVDNSSGRHAKSCRRFRPRPVSAAPELQQQQQYQLVQSVPVPPPAPRADPSNPDAEQGKGVSASFSFGDEPEAEPRKHSQHTPATRASSAPLGICLSSKQTSYAGRKKGRGAIYVNPMADAALLRETKNWGQVSPMSIGSEQAGGSSGSEGYGSRSSTPHNAKAARVKQSEEDLSMDNRCKSPSAASEASLCSSSPTGLTDDSKLRKLLGLSSSKRVKMTRITGREGDGEGKEDGAVELTSSARVSTAEPDEPRQDAAPSCVPTTLETPTCAETQQRFELNIKISGYSQVDTPGLGPGSATAHPIVTNSPATPGTEDVMHKLEIIHNDLKNSRTGMGSGFAASCPSTSSTTVSVPQQPVGADSSLTTRAESVTDVKATIAKPTARNRMKHGARLSNECLMKAMHRKSCADDLAAAGAGPMVNILGRGGGVNAGEALPPELPEHHYLSLSDLTVTFKSVVGQKLLQGCSANSIDTLMELDLAARNNSSSRPAETRNSLVQTDLGLI